MKVSQELSRKIEAELQEYILNSEPAWTSSEKTINLRNIASELKILPLYLDWSGAFGIRSNGEIVSFNYEKPYEIKIEENQRIINLVLYNGITDFSPQLREL